MAEVSLIGIEGGEGRVRLDHALHLREIKYRGGKMEKWANGSESEGCERERCEREGYE